MKQLILIPILIFLISCSISIYNVDNQENYFIESTDSLIGMHERHDREVLREFLGVDPVRVEWCAAFVNAVLREMDIPESGYFHNYPLLARSFLNWGEKISEENIKIGDVVIFSRGIAGWQGHVGFFYGSFIDENGVEYWNILGGNQNNMISIKPYRASRSIGIRRWTGYIDV